MFAPAGPNAYEDTFPFSAVSLDEISFLLLETNSIFNWFRINTPCVKPSMGSSIKIQLFCLTKSVIKRC